MKREIVFCKNGLGSNQFLPASLQNFLLPIFTLILRLTVIMRSHLKNDRRIFFLPYRDLNHGPTEPKASVLPMNYADPYCVHIMYGFQHQVLILSDPLKNPKEWMDCYATFTATRMQ